MASSNYPQSPSFFGRPAPILGSDLAPDDTLSSRVSAALSPTDAFEEMWVADIVDLSLDVFQQRRVKAGPIASNHRRSLPDALVLHGKEPGERPSPNDTSRRTPPPSTRSTQSSAPPH